MFSSKNLTIFYFASIHLQLTIINSKSYFVLILTITKLVWFVNIFLEFSNTFVYILVYFCLFEEQIYIF